MNNRIKLSQVVDRLNESNIEYKQLKLQNEWSIIICAYGGRIFGPFKNNDSESIFWMSESFASKKDFDALISSRHWNIGGDRFWVAPELPFFVKRKDDFFNTYITQGELDPGNYTIINNNESIKLAQQVCVKTYETHIKEKSFFMERTIAEARNPLSSMAELNNEIEYFGFSQEVDLHDTGTDKSLYLESWLLTQVNPKGKLIVPFTGSALDYTDYYEPINKDFVQIQDHLAYIDVTGDVRYKLGFKAAQMTGRSAYLGELSDGTYYLFVRNYFNDLSNIYCAAPYFAPEQYGCSLYLYNDPGSQGGFAEFENSGTTISGDTGINKAKDRVYYYFFVGDESNLKKLASDIL